MTERDFVKYQFEMVSLKPFKELATKFFKPNSLLHTLILKQPDELPRLIALGKLLAFAELFEIEYE